MTSGASVRSEYREDPDGTAVECFAVPIDEAFLFELIKDVFEHYWDRLVFGPMIQGAAYEIRCPNAPRRMSLRDGYLTIDFGGTHFHLCIGENRGSDTHPTPPALAARRRCARAEFYRRPDARGAPISWGFRMFNGASEPQISVLFPNPWLNEADQIVQRPDWNRLTMWEELTARYLGRPPDPKDRSAMGFTCH